MKRRLILMLLVMLLMAFLMNGCSTTTEASENNPFLSRFSMLYAGAHRYVIVDTKTGVCYLRDYDNRGVGMTVLLDSDGTPLLYEEAWQQMCDEVNQ